MTVIESRSLELREDQDIVRTRQAVRQISQEYRFGLVDQTKVVTAASELARNTIIHGGGGSVSIEVLMQGVKTGVRLTFTDKGPGIPDIGLAMTDGWTSGKGLGLGLTGAKRLSSEFELVTQPGHGTRVTITRWK